MKNFQFFSGTDCTILVIFSNESITQTIQLGNAAAIQGAIRVEGTPRYCMGEADPVGFSSGKRIISGSLVLETLNKAFITEISKVLHNDFKNKYTVDKLTSDNGGTYDVGNFIYIDQLPELDIVIELVRPDNPNITAKRTIKGVKFVSESSGIGLSTLDIQEQIGFLAREITPLTYAEKNN